MSEVTNVVLLCSEPEKSLPIKNFTKFFDDYDYKFVKVSGHPDISAHMYIDVWIGAFNHLCLEELIDTFNKQKWERPRITRLLLLNEYQGIWDTYPAALLQNKEN